MAEYERSITINVTRQQIEDFVSDVSNLPKYIPTTKNAQPQQGERVRVQGVTPNGHQYDADGYFRLDKTTHRMEWGSDGENKYSGYLTFRGSDVNAPSHVTVHLSIEPPPQVSKQMAQQKGSQDSAIEEGLDKALQSIKNILEGKGGKVEVQPS